MKIELLYVPGCPNYRSALETIKDVLGDTGVSEQITEIAVLDSTQAVALGFPGSPTVRIDGRDVEPGIPTLSSFGLSCRTYVVNGRRQGIPDREWIRRAVASSSQCTR